MINITRRGKPVAPLMAVTRPRKRIDAALLQSVTAAMPPQAENAADLGQRAAALAMFDKRVADSFTVLPVTGGQFPAAARFADQHTLALRAGDGLHLATASEHGAIVHTLDRRLAEAGPVLGAPTRLLA